MAKFSVILPAAGKSSRFGDRHYKKPFAPLDNKAVWLHSADRFLKRSDVKQLIVVLDAEDMEDFQLKFGANVAILGIDVVKGGKERTDSVANGLAAVRADIDYVAVHDAARPCIADEWIDKVFAAAVESGAATLASPVTNTLKQVRSDMSVVKTVSREHLWQSHTPQVFRKDLLEQAFQSRGQTIATDEAQLAELAGIPVKVVPCSASNIKITSREDLKIASALLKTLPQPKLDNPAHPFADDQLWR